MVQEALLTPLMLTWRRLSPLDFFFSFLFLFFFSLPVRTFFTMECRDSDFAKFTVLTLKVCLKDSSQSVFHNKKNLLLLLWGAKILHCFLALAIFLSAGKRCKDTFPPTLHHLSPGILATATVVELYYFAILGSVSIVIHNVKLRLLIYWPGSGSCDLSRLLGRKITKGIHSCKLPKGDSRRIIPQN